MAGCARRRWGWFLGVVLVIGFAVGPFAPKRGGAGSGATLWFVTPFVVLFFGAFLLIVLVVLFNWPKWPVPPHLRDESGALKTWFRR